MNFCTEQAIDKAAEKLGMDPLEIRLKNHIRTGDPVRTFNAMYEELGLPVPNLFLSSCGLSECIKKGAEVIGWKEKWKGWAQPVEANGPKRRGLGMAVANHECGLSFLGAPCVTVMINRDGTAQLLTNAGRMGQGLETTQTQIAAEELGLRFESINGKYDDTDACPWGICTYASVGAHQVGRVTQAAAADAKRQLCEFASKQLGAKPEELDIKDGIIHIKHQPEKGIRICDLFSPEFFSAPTIVGTAALNLDKSLFAQPLMAHFVEVEVDIETGRIKILKYVAVHDSGKIINPEVTENQVHGGVFQGCGLALVEDLVFDERSGAVLNPNYVDYKILRALDMPDPEVIFEEVIDPVGPFGVKGLGEAPANPTVAAVAQAIHNAIGVRFNRVPITGEMVLKALRGGATEYGYDSSKGVG
jgi:xanthine dehydrogenase molybdenum-binding subunit